jgi:uridine kinase
VPQLIRVAEGFQEKRITLIADAVQREFDHIDAICIAGPSSSGKSTFIRRLCVQLQVNGINPVALGLDDYYIDRELTPRDETGDYDFEAFDAIQLPLLHDHLRRIFDGQAVQTARYHFAEGKSDPKGGAVISLGERDILVLEGIHGLNPLLLSDTPPERVFRVFICPLAQLAFDHLSRVHASDVRLVRRIVRDRHSRGHSAADTIARWPKVRAAERKYIFPYQTNADAVFDTSLIYELSVLRVYAERYLLEVPRDSAAYSTAFRLLHELSRFVSIYPDHVPPTSILREFIGGSGFEY